MVLVRKRNGWVLLLLFVSMLISGCSYGDETPQDDVVEMNYLQEDGCYQYYYETLNAKEKKIYEEIYNGVIEHRKHIAVSTNEEAIMKEMIDKVLSDHAELFYCKNMFPLCGEQQGEIVVHYEKDLTDDALKTLQEQLQNEVKRVVSQMDASASDYEKAKFVYEYIVQNCEYEESAKNNQDVRSVIFYGKSVCAGYAHTAQMLLNALGVKCAYLSGKAIDEEGKESLHAWNVIEINDDYYYMDSTWGDAKDPDHICYGYFMMSESEMRSLYEPDYETSSTQVYDNSYIETNTYVTVYDENLITMILEQALQNGNRVAEIKCAPQCYEEVKNQLFGNHQIFSLFEKQGYYYDSVVHAENDRLCLIDIIL